MVLFARQSPQEEGSSLENSTESILISRECYGFKTECTPQPLEETKLFEKALLELISRIEFGNVTSKFQNKLRDDIEKMKEVNEVKVSSDKTINHYKMKKDKYNKLLVENVACEYEKSTAEEVENVNKKSAEISRRLEMEDCMDIYTES